MKYHEPVLLNEVMDGLKVGAGKRFIDATFGGGGHTKEMLALGAEVLAVDEDPDAIKEAQHIQSTKFLIQKGNFRDIDEIAHKNGWQGVDGVLFDLGVSSHQLDTAGRGFSYKFADSPYDLRFDQEAGMPAWEIINHENEEQLKTIIGTYGEEEHCGLIAHALVHSRIKNPIRTTQDVVRVIEKVVDKKERNETLSRVFQAFRMYVNDELVSLTKGLEGVKRIVKPGGRIGVISFHSLEDRIVKRFFQKPEFLIVTKKPVRPTEDEVQRNRRSRSAKLRIAEKI